MKGFFLLVFFFFLFSLSNLIAESREADTREKEKKKVYIIYMGAANSPKSLLRKTHVQLLASVLDSEEDQVVKRIVHSYGHGFSGCAARLTAQEAHAIAQNPQVVRVFEDPILKLHTTRSWDFLQYEALLESDSIPGSNSYPPSYKGRGRGRGKGKGPASPSPSHKGRGRGRTDSIIGILDTGIWPESESFNDKGMGPIPSRWKGVCTEGYQFNASNCNRKLIGARYYGDTSPGDHDTPHMPYSASSVVHASYNEFQTPRDDVGHGTHTASTAAGSLVQGASYYGLAAGIARGGSPGSRIAVYKVCPRGGCPGSTILAGFDDAIRDGVDVLSVSLGASSSFAPDFANDPIAIGSFHAVERGITVVCSAGNDGPTSQSVVNTAPWILTVAATTIDRTFESDVVLGGNKVVKGEAINFSKLRRSPVYPLLYGKSDSEGSYCYPDPNKIKGKIVLCERSDGDSRRDIMNEMMYLGGIGLILVDDSVEATASYGDFPMTVISSKQAASIRSYIKSTRNPVATILATKSVTKSKPAPLVSYFSSRGPSPGTPNILKPDIAAPGENILAAWIETNDTANVPAGQKPSRFKLLSGTSMACPHVSGVAAAIKSMNRHWNPSAIRSAIMTTASHTNNERSQITTDLGSKATPYDYGAGEVSPSKALQPGLVYETTKDDYLQFLCNYGYDVRSIKLITEVPKGFNCHTNNRDLISELNYPSIAIANFTRKMSRRVTRTVTEVSDYSEDTLYVVSVQAPNGLSVKVWPDRLHFKKTYKKSNIKEKMSYRVTFSWVSLHSPNHPLFGSITWTSGKYWVRTPFVVSFS